jgi:hypothetical protein
MKPDNTLVVNQALIKRRFFKSRVILRSALELFDDMLLTLVFIHEHVYLNIPLNLSVGITKQPGSKKPTYSKLIAPAIH